MARGDGIGFERFALGAGAGLATGGGTSNFRTGGLASTFTAGLAFAARLAGLAKAGAGLAGFLAGFAFIVLPV